jgi:[ribosomal protein S5]-alanine N-acetyltransferase
MKSEKPAMEPALDPPPAAWSGVRVQLRLPDPASAHLLANYLMRNAHRFEPLSPQRDADYYGVDACYERAHIQRASSLAGVALHQWLFAVGHPRRLLGEIHVTNVVRGAFQAAYLGYALDGQHEGQGLMYEALQLTLHHTFQVMGLHRLMANYLPTNERSGRLLRRLGFSVEGYARDYLQIAGRWQDHVLTSKTSELPSATDR